MDSLFNAICVLVTAAVMLTFVPGFRLRERSLLSMRDKGSALLVFIVLGLVEELSVLRSGQRGSLHRPFHPLLALFLFWLRQEAKGLKRTPSHVRKPSAPR